MKKIRNIYAGMIGLMICIPVSTFAQVEITEIMFDIEGTDTGREWIELYNDGTEVLLKEVTVFENNVQHKLDTSEVVTLPGSTYLVVADNKEKFLIDNPTYTGLVVDSVFSLANTGETISVYVNGAENHKVSYTAELGGNGDGNSLHWSEGLFAIGLPTPGAPKTQDAATKPAEDTTSNNSIPTSGGVSSHAETVGESSLPQVKLKADAGRDRIVSAKVPITFVGRMQANSKEVEKGTYTWSFGDGQDAQGKEVTHTYSFPGEYVVVLNTRFEGVKAVSRTKVIVENPEVTISQVDKVNGFIELYNASKNEINIGTWSIGGKINTYIFAQDTIILPQSKIKISFAFSKETDEILELLLPDGKVIDTEETTLLTIAQQIKLLENEIEELTLNDKNVV